MYIYTYISGVLCLPSLAETFFFDNLHVILASIVATDEALLHSID